jgi:5-methyltetrahydropteroyltriglutamate--homocysteine methyltransferase
MRAGDVIFRAENVGSLLRPAWLLEARARHVRGEIDGAALGEVEDRAVDEAVALQERAGLDVLTDGEQRRNVFASQIVQAAEGFEHVAGNEVDWFRLDGSVERSPVTVAVTGRIRRRRFFGAGELAYLRTRTLKPVKVTVPSPTMYAYYWAAGISDGAYPSPQAYLEDVAAFLKEEVDELARRGADYIQIDAPELGMLLDPHQQAWFAAKGFDPDRLIHDAVDLSNAVVAAFTGTVGLHVCRGNDANRYMARGGYERLAEVVFPRTAADVLLLEYDDERSGGFAPLACVPDDKVVVLGLVSTKRPKLEPEAELRARIEEASRYVPRERLALSTQCGFASVARGNALTVEQQERKLALVARVARAVWG